MADCATIRGNRRACHHTLQLIEEVGLQQDCRVCLEQILRCHLSSEKRFTSTQSSTPILQGVKMARLQLAQGTMHKTQNL